MAWHDGLTVEQKRAASHVGKHARLLAGPGTGKTRSLTRRVLYLVEEKGVKPSKILALTFTRAATAELRGRVEADLGENDSLPHISTLHSFALKTILENPTRVRLPQPVRIADDYEERWIIQEELRRILGLGRVSEVADRRIGRQGFGIQRSWAHGANIGRFMGTRCETSSSIS